ncbi:protein DGCR6L-like [Paramacrobiotus metropolitanus]|uniref:protein DGCR6L-like n=1 Tax=Paramacrobiotus metropolitanus TaxID=2943436 RepID=UPI002445B495|nr:protein DGCR6L-like [Paramacrobiotus metropolitanus]XP_055336007.1 protein DGCR6L-like [Paramacrobiotus metropolitanus]
MERRGQPDSPEPDIVIDFGEGLDSNLATTPNASHSEMEPNGSKREPEDEEMLVSDHTGPLSFPVASSPAVPGLSPAISLQGLELTPGVAAALKKMLDEKNRKEATVAQMKSIMDWDAVGEDVRLLFPEDFLFSLANWIINHNQPDVIKQCILDQNRKEAEFHKKREDMVNAQQKELHTLQKTHQEALTDCDHKNTPHRKPIIAKQNDEELHKILARQKEELFSLDRKIVAAIDQLLTAQQRRFNEVGIPGMKESMEPTDILQQMVVVDVIAKISGIDVVVAPALE